MQYKLKEDTLEYQLAHCDGKDCTCMAYGECECACNADWTPAEVYLLRDQVDALRKDVERIKIENIKLRNACRAFLDFVMDRGGRWAEMQEILADALGDAVDTGKPAAMPFGDMPKFPTIRGE